MKEIVKNIDQVSVTLLETAELFNQENFNQVPFKDSWTAAQVCEHLAKGVNPGVLYGGTKTTDRNPEEQVEPIKKVFLDFSTKLKSPDFILPSDNYQEKKDLIETLRSHWEKIRYAAENFDLTLTCTDFAMPVVGYLTRSEMIWFYVFHTQRHIHQLKKILAVVEQGK